MKIPNKLYDVLKWVVVIVIPALTVCYTQLAGVWMFPYPEQIAQTSAIICTLLGAIIGISSAQYYQDSSK